ncbi:helix-turn-helix domain-containing protein [Chloroflexota bacterium]
MAKLELSTELPLEWLTVGEAASYLRVSKRTIYRWTRDGKIPAYLIGNHRNRRYRRDDLDKVPRLVDMQTFSSRKAEELND